MVGKLKASCNPVAANASKASRNPVAANASKASCNPVAANASKASCNPMAANASKASCNHVAANASKASQPMLLGELVNPDMNLNAGNGILMQIEASQLQRAQIEPGDINIRYALNVAPPGLPPQSRAQACVTLKEHFQSL
jgi:hypothetical protein